ncbi:MAG: rod shape-determining protein MreD [Sedimentisphaerales bacterium]|nr:rod shape-determining protein MreD [Sedimentisphaerales bacterium]
MHWLRFAVLLLVATILQASFLADLNSKPDLLLILLVFFAVYSDTSDAIICSFVIGFAADLIGPTMGPQMISYGIFGSALAYLHRVITIRKIPYQIAAIFITALLAGALSCLLNYLKGQPSPAKIFAPLFGIALYSSLVGPFLFLPFVWWMRIKKPGRFGRR